MSNQRYVQGLAKLTEIDGEAGEKVIRSLADICPDLGKSLLNILLGIFISVKGSILRRGS